MGSKWKLPASHKEGNESPAFHRLHTDEDDEERLSLVDSEADCDDDLIKFDDDGSGNGEKRSSLSPARGDSPRQNQSKHRRSPLHLLSPLAKLKGENTEGEERRSLIDDDDEDDAEDVNTTKVSELIYQNINPEDDSKPNPLVKKPVASKWGMLKKPADESTKPMNEEERTDVVGAALLNKENQPEPPKPGGAWLKLKDMKNSAPTDEIPGKLTSSPLTGDTNAAPKLSGWGKLKAHQNESPATNKEESNNAPKVSNDAPRSTGWGKLRARQNIQNNDSSITNNDTSNDVPKSSGWGKLRARQNLQTNESASGEPNNISTENPGPRKLDSLANAAYAVHATQKVTGLLKDKTKVRMALKERMAKLVAERLTVKQIFKRYVETSTLHGFCYVFSETFMIRRIMWAILMILGAVYFLMKLNDGVIKYFSYPFSTLSSMEYVPNLIFPAMSFCPINPYKLNSFNESILHKLQQSNGLPLFSNLTDPGYDIDGQQLHDAILNATHDISDLAQECDWIQQDTAHPYIPYRECGPHNLTKFISERGEVCFTLNSGKKEHPLLNVDHSGLGYGYELLFDLNAPGSIVTHSYNGIRVILHDQSEPPTSSTGFILTPGFKSFVSMERTETINLPPPMATKCGSRNLEYFEVYNQKSCFLEIITNMVSKRCGCRQHYMPGNKTRYCSLQEEIHCARPYKDQISKFKLIDQCPIECLATTFSAKITDSRYLHNPPQGIVPKSILRKLAQKDKNSSHIVEINEKLKGDELDVYIEENIIQAIFFFPEMKKYVNNQKQKFSFYNFLGDMGGEFGLMLGASLLTFAEFMDLIIFLVYHQLLRLHKQKMEEQEQKTDTECHPV